MPRKQIDFDTIREIGLSLPGVEESSTYGARALKVNGKLLACEPRNRSAEPHSLMVRVSLEEREHLLAEAPDVYYITDHYAPYPSVRVRLRQANPGIVGDLLRMAHRFVTEKAGKKSKVASGKRRTR